MSPAPTPKYERFELKLLDKTIRMPSRDLPRVTMALAAAAVLGACGSAPAEVSTLSAGTAAIPNPAHASTARLRDWPEFGLDPQRSDVSTLSTGITAANVAHLHRVTVNLPGTIDSSPSYLHEASVMGRTHNVVIVTTTYGKTLAIDATSGRVLWMFTPSGYAHWAGSPQITTTSPLVDPDRRFVYAASPDGLVHKLSLIDGGEAQSALPTGTGRSSRAHSEGHRQVGWPVSITRDATHEKLAAALNIAGRYLLAATGGYFGDAPPYQGHVVAIDRETGRIASVYNTLCADRHQIIVPSSCSASDSAILSRGGAVVEPGGKRLLLSTGNGPWNGSTNFGDSVVELTLPSLRFRQAFTPTNQAELNETDTDLGSSAPVLLGQDRVVIAGKDGVMRVLALSHLDGHMPARANRLGGEVQRLPLPGGGELFTAPAVWTRGKSTTVFVGDEHATAAYALIGGRLQLVWQNGNPGTSPVLASGLLYVYDPAGGGIYVYRPRSGRPIAKLPGAAGHWNSPIVVDGHVVEPEGNANDHALTGTLDLFSAE
jgi:PQQ-like domain